MPAGTANMLLVIASAFLADGAASSSEPFDHEKSLIEAGLQKWRGHVAYFDRKKDSWVCETNVTSGDKKIDKLACATMTICYNRYDDEFNALLNMTGNIEAQHAAARRFHKKKWDCFRLESEPLVRELALRRVAGGRGGR
jgi:hypothetical protein